MRTDEDDWDITTSVGATALGIAALRSLASHDKNPLIVDPYAELFLAHTSSNIFGITPPDDHERKTDKTSGKSYPPFVEWMKIFITARTRIIDDALTEAVERGIYQIVLLASGLDTRAYRLEALRAAHVFEIDREQVLHFKHHILDSHHVQPLCERTAIVADLRENWLQKLIAAGFDPTAKTCWVTEGLLPYLPGEAQYALADTINNYSSLGSRWIIEISNAEVYNKYAQVPWKMSDEIEIISLWYPNIPSSRDLVSTWTVQEKLVSDFFSEDCIPVTSQAEKDFLHYSFHSTGFYIADKTTP